jgi:replication initiation protein RepC
LGTNFGELNSFALEKVMEMQIGSVTTPFGRRPMTLGMLADQLRARQVAPTISVDKWKLFRSLCEARKLFGISDRTLAVLNALLSFYPKTELSDENGLVVFPSNSQLSLRTHGMADTTLRRHLAALIDAGMISRKDSPNGKRYARKGRGGDISDAFGFSLAPLLARAEQIEKMADEVIAERMLQKQLKEQVSLYRRDIAKLIETGLHEHLPGDWLETQLRFSALCVALPRAPQTTEIEILLENLAEFRDQLIKFLETHINLSNESANDGHIGGHIQNSDINLKSESENAAPPTIEAPFPKIVLNNLSHTKPFPLDMVRRACPEIAMYGPAGSISSWRDLVIAAQVVRSMLDISASAYQRACEVMGLENTASVLACMLERATQITSAGGYLRDLTRRAETGGFSLGPMLMALLRGRGNDAKLAA